SEENETRRLYFAKKEPGYHIAQRLLKGLCLCDSGAERGCNWDYVGFYVLI
ncbi:unnamed protein product, partial [Amoebophrya sp. A120]